MRWLTGVSKLVIGCLLAVTALVYGARMGNVGLMANAAGFFGGVIVTKALKVNWRLIFTVFVLGFFHMKTDSLELLGVILGIILGLLI